MQSLRDGIRDYLMLHMHYSCGTMVAIKRFAKFESPQRPNFWTLFFGLTSKIPPLGSTLNFDADVKETTGRHPM